MPEKITLPEAKNVVGFPKKQEGCHHLRSRSHSRYRAALFLGQKEETGQREARVLGLHLSTLTRTTESVLTGEARSVLSLLKRSLSGRDRFGSRLHLLKQRQHLRFLFTTPLPRRRD